MALQPLIHNSTARRMAKTILNGFRSYFADYLNSTLTAKARFEKADWRGVRDANVDRLELYKDKVAQTVKYLGIVTNKDLESLLLWREAKKAYTQLVFNFPNFEIAETFFNSVFSDIHDHDKISDDIVYVISSQLIEAPEAEYSIYVRYEGENFRDTFKRILEEAEFSLPMEDLSLDLDCVMEVFNKEIAPQIKSSPKDVKFDLLESTFYRSKAAYMVGRVVDKDQTFPMALVILNTEDGGLYVDTALFNGDELSVVFSFTRNHFMVDAPLPYQYAHFLKNLMPNKLDYEIYNSLGFPKHAKTEFYRQLVGHLDNSDDQFIVAPGIKGMVMSVFTLPSYNIVFKIIKDKFESTKALIKFDHHEAADKAVATLHNSIFCGLPLNVCRAHHAGREPLDKNKAITRDQKEQEFIQQYLSSSSSSSDNDSFEEKNITDQPPPNDDTVMWELNHFNSQSLQIVPTMDIILRPYTTTAFTARIVKHNDKNFEIRKGRVSLTCGPAPCLQIMDILPSTSFLI